MQRRFVSSKVKIFISKLPFRALLGRCLFVFRLELSFQLRHDRLFLFPVFPVCGGSQIYGGNGLVEEFRNRSLAGTVYPVLWVDALYEKVRVDGRIVSMAVLIVCEVDGNGHRDIIAVEPIAEESRSSYGVLF